MPKPVDILLVEDYEPDAQLILILLKKNRIANKVQLVRDGAEALDYVFCRGAYQKRSFDHPPGVVLLDIRLPKMDGWEVLRQIRQDKRTGSIPVIMLSGSLFTPDLQKGKQLGALGCITKPMQFEKLPVICSRNTGFAWSVTGQDPSIKK